MTEDSQARDECERSSSIERSPSGHSEERHEDICYRAVSSLPFELVAAEEKISGAGTSHSQLLVAKDNDGTRWEFTCKNGKVVLTRHGRAGTLTAELCPKRETEYEGPNGGKFELGYVTWKFLDNDGIPVEEGLPVLSGFDAAGNLISMQLAEPISKMGSSSFKFLWPRSTD